MTASPNGYGSGRGGRPWRRKVEQVKQRDRFICQKCRRVTENGEADHVIPLAQGGTDDLGNLQWLCKEPCHKEKTLAEMGAKPKTAFGADGWPIR